MAQVSEHCQSLINKRELFVKRICEVYELSSSVKNDPNLNSIFKARFAKLDAYYTRFEDLQQEIVEELKSVDGTPGIKIYA